MEDEVPGGEPNPAQAEVLAALGARPHERPEFDPRLRAELRAELEDRLAPVAARLPEGETLWVSKHLLGSVHGCEGLFLAQDAEEFAWSTQTARGTVSHKAIELSVSWRGDPSAGELVDEAIARLIASDARIGDYLGGLREGERAELHGEATERVNMFLECFPRLEPRWRPVAESRLRADLNDDRIVLSGKVDLTVGRGGGAARREGAGRPEDRRLLARPPRGPPLLRAGRDACASVCRLGCSPRTTSTAAGCSRNP